jgi:tRNA(fMet)-specific endonuclease VapC
MERSSASAVRCDRGSDSNGKKTTIWLAVIAKEKLTLRQVVGYRELALLFKFYEEFEIVPFDEAAARQFDDLRRQKLRIGSRDLKIAATALVNDALLLSANLTDFKKVPGLRVENWLD